MVLHERGDGEELRRVEGREMVIRVHYVTKKSIFNKKRKSFSSLSNCNRIGCSCIMP